MADHVLAVLQYPPPPPHLGHTPCPGAFPFTEFEYSKSHQDDMCWGGGHHLIKGDFRRVSALRLSLNRRTKGKGEGVKAWGGGRPQPVTSSASLCAELLAAKSLFRARDLECKRVM